jgi:glycosyltransferase involved in cell wall biosynthesis
MVRGDTTPGLRRGDDSLADALRRLGCSVAEVSPNYKIRRLLPVSRFIGVVPDLAQILDARRATTAALKRFQPKCIIYCPWFPSAMQPKSRLGSATAIRFDSPPSLSRRGRGGAFVLRALERRAFRATGLLLPWGVRVPENLLAVLPIDARIVALPVPIAAGRPDSDPDSPRSALTVFYAGSNPHKKGLDIALSAWRRAAPATMRLAIAGIEPDVGKRWCNRHRVEVADTVDWVGCLEPEAFRQLLRTCSFYLAASRYEDHGLAQLEALSEGALLVTVPSAGPFEAITLARALPGELVAGEISSQALADALKSAFALPDDVRSTYRTRAQALTAVYSAATLDERLRNQVLPDLLHWRPGT